MTSDARPPEIRELPFRIVVFDDFGATSSVAEPSVVSGGVCDDVMAALRCARTVTVRNHFVSRPSDLDVTLRFGALRDFSPKAILAQVPELQSVAALYAKLGQLAADTFHREALAAELEPVRGMDALTAALDAAFEKPPGDSPAAPPPSAPSKPRDQADMLAELFDMVDVEGSSEVPAEPAASDPPPAKPEPKSAIGSAISSIAGGAKQRGGLTVAKAQIAELLAAQLRAILAAPEVRQVEAAHRGLRFLLAQSGSARVEVYSVAAADVASRLGGHVERELQDAAGAPTAVVVLGSSFANTAPDLANLTALAEHAEELQAPLLWSAAPDFVDGECVASLATRDQVRSLFDAASMVRWRSLRSKDAARWTGACLNRFVLRDGQTGGKGLPMGADVSLSEPLLGAPSYFAGALVARSHARTGWPCQFLGPHDGAIEGLPVVAGMPVEALLPEPIVTDLATHGVLALTAPRDRDTVLLLRGASTHDPAQFGNREEANSAERLMSSLPYQLLAARLAAITLAHKSGLVADPAPEAVQRSFELFFSGLLADTGDGAGVIVQVLPDPDDADGSVIDCKLRTGRLVMGSVVVELCFRGPATS